MPPGLVSQFIIVCYSGFEILYGVILFRSYFWDRLFAEAYFVFCPFVMCAGIHEVSVLNLDAKLFEFSFEGLCCQNFCCGSVLMILYGPGNMEYLLWS